MSPTWRLIRPKPISPSHHYRHIRHIADALPFRAGDHVLLRPCKDPRTASPLLSRPLNPTHRIETHKGIIPHSDIIGKRVRDVVRTHIPKTGKSGLEYRLHEVKLEEYVRLTRRLVTPLYPQDAQVIVGLMDLHPETCVEAVDPDESRLEILEAGTGHGALTLFLSRAIYAANPPMPWRRPGSQFTEEEKAAAVEAWKPSRRALLHTIDVSPRYSAHAQTIVAGFRHGLYAPNVDFHTGDVSAWTTAALTARNNAPFLSHAFLDLPNADTQLSAVASALRVDGTLIVFNPSITQIMAALAKVKDDGLPLELERVIELGVNGGTGGREWDVRAVKPRAAVKIAQEAAVSDEVAAEGVEADAREDSGVEVGRGAEQDARSPADVREKDDGWKMVCRPKVGDAVVGGGFLGVFRKLRTSA